MQGRQAGQGRQAVLRAMRLLTWAGHWFVGEGGLLLLLPLFQEGVCC
jgi:hypothetical protein